MITENKITSRGLEGATSQHHNEVSKDPSVRTPQKAQKYRATPKALTINDRLL